MNIPYSLIFINILLHVLNDLVFCNNRNPLRSNLSVKKTVKISAINKLINL